MTAHGFAGNFGGAIESQLPGQVVEEAKDRHEAIEEVTQSSPDIVFSTLRSPF
jgi:YesN/AraC family two-component response regulator